MLIRRWQNKICLIVEIAEWNSGFNDEVDTHPKVTEENEFHKWASYRPWKTHTVCSGKAPNTRLVFINIYSIIPN